MESEGSGKAKSVDWGEERVGIWVMEQGTIKRAGLRLRNRRQERENSGGEGDITLLGLTNTIIPPRRRF